MSSLGALWCEIHWGYLVCCCNLPIASIKKKKMEIKGAFCYPCFLTENKRRHCSGVSAFCLSFGVIHVILDLKNTWKITLEKVSPSGFPFLPSPTAVASCVRELPQVACRPYWQSSGIRKHKLISLSFRLQLIRIIRLILCVFSLGA